MNNYHPFRIPLVFCTLFICLLLILSGSPDVVAGPKTQVSNAGWAEIGTGSASGRGITDTNNRSRYPAFAAVNDMPVLAWTEQMESSDNEIYVKRWNGSQWVEFGSGAASGGGISNNSGRSGQTAMTVDGDGRPVVAWYDRSDGGHQIYLKRWNDLQQKWVEMGGSASGGGISSTDGDSGAPSLADTDLGIVVAWGDDEEPYEAGCQIYVRRWNAKNGEWEEIGLSSASGGIGISDTTDDSYFPSVAVDRDGYPIVAWVQDYCESGYEICPSEIYLKRWDDLQQAWLPMGGSASDGGISNNPGVSTRPSLAVDLTGTPIVAWQDNTSGDNQIYVKRWDDYHHVWVEMGGSASSGGISNTYDESRYPSLAIDPEGAPVVAWQDGPACADPSDDCDDEIFIRRWNKDTYEWEEMAEGSASGSGISDDKVGFSVRPKLIFTSSGEAMIAWRHSDDQGTDPDQLYGRRYTSCYDLTLTHTGQGGNPVPSPANSPGCPAGTYEAGEQITLTASPASGWSVGSWDGTDNDTSTAETNSLIMPASDHTTSVEYVTSCYVLTLTHTGEGRDPIASPANSPGCPAGTYDAGERISLTADPASDSKVAAWSGTDDDASTAEINALTMPDDDHTVNVAYAVKYDFIPLISFDCSRGPTELEPNDESGQANGPLCEGSVTIQGHPNDTWDYFKFKTSRTRDVFIEVKNHHGGGAQIALYYDWATVKNRKVYDSNAKDGLDIEYKQAEPGLYFISIYSATPNPGETTPYTLTLVCK
jgi:hypothetical protein